MFEAVRTRVLRVFRVPHDPDPPAGAPGSIRVFRAGRNFYKLRLLRWGAGQIGALVGIIFSLIILDRVQEAVDASRTEARPPVATTTPAPASTSGTEQTRTVAANQPAQTKTKSKFLRDDKTRAAVRRLANQCPSWLFGLLYALEWFGIIVYLAQIPITYAIARLDYELRWYIVTDRSLRIRAGLAAVQETTMSFANVQQVVVTQGPLQRLLGIADVRAQSAGGGGDRLDAHGSGSGDSLHTGVFHGVDNADEIRDLVQERLRAFRQAGLGDPDDIHTGESTSPRLPPHDSPPTSALAAARELLQEARRLRESLQ
jgi:membrane protein YdbS with pleckstrin-like domain